MCLHDHDVKRFFKYMYLIILLSSYRCTLMAMEYIILTSDFTLVGVISSDVSCSSCTTCFTPCNLECFLPRMPLSTS